MMLEPGMESVIWFLKHAKREDVEWGIRQLEANPIFDAPAGQAFIDAIRRHRDKLAA